MDPNLDNAFRMDIKVTEEAFTITLTGKLDNMPAIVDVFDVGVAEQIVASIESEMVKRLADHYDKSRGTSE